LDLVDQGAEVPLAQMGQTHLLTRKLQLAAAAVQKVVRVQALALLAAQVVEVLGVQPVDLLR
jgi:hypothetical protein